MAVAAAAALLDELMGRSRNDSGTSEKKIVRWEDVEYCKYYMVQFCPHDLFVNTRADLGPCPKMHCDEAKRQYQNAEGLKKKQYEEDFVRFAQSMLNDVERKIAKGEQRLALMGKSEPPQKLSSAETQKNEEQINLLNEKINSLVKEAEQMGIQGNVEQAQGLMKLCDQLKEEKESLLRQNENSQWSNTMELAGMQEKQMEVCKVCGAFLIVGDAQSRIDDHLMGKQHTGYGRLKSAVDEIHKRWDEERIERDRKRDEARMQRSATRDGSERSRYSNRSRSPRKYECYDRNRDNRSYVKGRSSDRYGSLERNRDSSRETLDKDTQRYRDGDRHRSRDGDRHRSRDGDRHRSRDGDRHRSRDGDRHRSKDSDRERYRDRCSRYSRSDSYNNDHRGRSMEDRRSERHSRDKESKDCKYSDKERYDEKHRHSKKHKRDKRLNGYDDESD